MLAERFAEVEQARVVQGAERAAARAARDAFIAAQMPAASALLADTVQRVSGSHPLLAVQRVTGPHAFPNRSFLTLPLTDVTVRSTLYGVPESVVFAPDLESRDREQFGVIRVVLDGLDEERAPRSVQPILARGLVVLGTTSARIVIPQEQGFVDLTDDRIERLLCALLVRT